VFATTETIGGFLKQYGWEYETHEEGFLVTGFRGKTGSFRIFIQIADNWVILAIVPFTPAPVPECRDRLCRFLLRLNYEINLAKIGVDDEGDVALVVEMRSEDLRFEDIAEALDALSFYADEYYLPLANLATDPAYKPPHDFDVWSDERQ